MNSFSILLSLQGCVKLSVWERQGVASVCRFGAHFAPVYCCLQRHFSRGHPCCFALLKFLLQAVLSLVTGLKELSVLVFWACRVQISREENSLLLGHADSKLHLIKLKFGSQERLKTAFRQPAVYWSDALSSWLFWVAVVQGRQWNSFWCR